MKETKRIYALNSKKNRAYDEISTIKGRGDKKWWRSLRHKSVIHYKRKFKIKNVIVGVKYKCGYNIFKKFGAPIRDFYGTWVNISPRKARFRKQQKTLRNKEKGGYRTNDNG